MRCAAAAVTMAQGTQATAAADGHNRGHIAIGDGDLMAADRAGHGRNSLVRAAVKLLDAVGAGLKASDDQRFIQLGAAARAQLKYLAAGVARAGDADIVRARRAALFTAGFQRDFMDDQRCALKRTGVGILGRIGADGLHVLAAAA